MTKLASKAILIISLVLFMAGLLLTSVAPQYLLELTRASSQLSQEMPKLFALIFIAVFTGLITLGLPGGAIFSVLSGYFFGAGLGFVVCWLSTTSSALCVWMLVRHSGTKLPTQPLAEQQLTLLRFVQQHAFTTTLFIRLIPVVPFYLGSLLLSYSGTRLNTYWLATALGVIPSTLAFAWIGRGLQSLVATQEVSLLDVVFMPMFYLPVLSLCLLSLTALVVKRIKTNSPR